jgi:hypothetical protein
MKNIDNIIIGCGPAAIQCAYYFEKYNIEYIILEKNSICGSFFNKYPLSETLISINKKYVGSNDPDFKLRHDWNSLLNDEYMNFSEYDDNYYPNSNNYVKYLNDFSNKYNLKIKFNTEVKCIYKRDNQYKIDTHDKNYTYICNKLIVATGLSLPNIPNISMDIRNKVKHYCDFPKGFLNNKKELKAEFENKNVLIIGAGNSAFEIATVLNDENITRSITMTTPTIPHFSFITHYSGNVRSKYLSYLDTFFLKSLNGINSRNTRELSIQQDDLDGPYTIYDISDDMSDNIESKKIYGIYDKIIFCTGWKFDNSIFDFDVDLTINNKYPNINLRYESVNNNNLFFIGSLMHSIDYKVSSGGFVHGFRYLIKYFIELNYTFKHEVKIIDIKTEKDIIDLSKYIIHRINTSSNMYLMYGILCDIIVYNKKEKKIVYYHNTNAFIKNRDHDDIIYIKIVLEYGDRISDINEITHAHGHIKGHESKAHLIHPIIQIYDNNIQMLESIHFKEDILANFSCPLSYENIILRMLKSIL